MAKKVIVLVHGKHRLSVSEAKAKALVDDGQAEYMTKPVAPKAEKKPAKETTKKKKKKKKSSKKSKKSKKS